MNGTDELTNLAGKRMGRRSLLRKGAILGAALPAAGGLLVAGCYDDPTGQRAEPKLETKQPAGAATATGHGTSDAQPAAAQGVSAEEMDRHHEEKVKQFLQNIQSPITKGKGNVPLAPRLESGVKVWDLTIDEFEWETTPGNMEKARGYNQMVPGPILRATEGDRVRINFKNNLKESTAVHWHGLIIENKQDGVPFVTQPPIKPGESYTYEFTIRNFGTHMYHSHHNALDQVNRGLLGAFIVDPKDASKTPAHDVEYIMVLNDTYLGFTINGKGFPATEPIVAKKGQKLLVRYLNEGEMIHPMHLHGLPQLVVAIDGYPLPNPYYCDTVNVGPGNRYDVLVDCTEEGLWAFHCHILGHAESASGMFGLVTVLVVQA